MDTRIMLDAKAALNKFIVGNNTAELNALREAVQELHPQIHSLLDEGVSAAGIAEVLRMAGIEITSGQLLSFYLTNQLARLQAVADSYAGLARKMMIGPA